MLLKGKRQIKHVRGLQLQILKKYIILTFLFEHMFIEIKFNFLFLI